MIKQLQVYQENARGTYRGICREFFPRWVGWKLLEEGASEIELEKAVEDFYMVYFFYQLKLDLIEDLTVQFMLLNFATSQGKKKAMSKLQKATGSHLEGTQLINEFNRKGLCAVYKLKLELLDFYYLIGKPQDGAWVLSC